MTYLNSKKEDLFNGKKVTYRGKVYWANMTTKEIYAHSVDEEIAGSVSGYKVADITDNWDIVPTPSKVYFISDDCTTSSAVSDYEVLKATSEADAIRAAWAAWDRLTAHDQRKRDAFCLCYGVLDEDGIPEDGYDVVIDVVKAAPVYAAFDEDAAEIRAELETEMADGYRQAMDADLELRLDELREEYKRQYPDLF